MKKLLAIGCTLLLAVGLVACSSSSTSSSTDSSAKTTQTETKKENKATLAQFEQIKEGMTYAEVVGIFGFEGTKASSAGNIEGYTWTGNGGIASVVSISFTDGKVSYTMQIGLE